MFEKSIFKLFLFKKSASFHPRAFFSLRKPREEKKGLNHESEKENQNNKPYFLYKAN